MLLLMLMMLMLMLLLMLTLMDIASTTTRILMVIVSVILKYGHNTIIATVDIEISDRCVIAVTYVTLFDQFLLPSITIMINV